MGHLRRCLAVAERLQHHDIWFIADDLDTEAHALVARRGWRIVFLDEAVPDLWILDRLDNTDMGPLDGMVVALEDQSNYPADLVVNALYKPDGFDKTSVGSVDKYGADWCVLRPEFLAGDYQVRDEVKRILIMFGGTDPSGLGERVYDVCTVAGWDVDWIRPGDDRAVAEAMHSADLLITSAGRTVYEAAAVGIPTIVLAQNLRETTHAHLGYEHGNIYLGLGKLVSDKVIVDTIDVLSDNEVLRQELSDRGRPDGLGLDRIVHAVEGLLGGL